MFHPFACLKEQKKIMNYHTHIPHNPLSHVPTCDSNPAWPPNWLDSPIPATSVEAGEPAAEPVAVEPVATEGFPSDIPEWLDIEDADREYLLGPPVGSPPTVAHAAARRAWRQQRHPGPCPFCGGRARHGALCRELRGSWEPALRFGKHRGRRLSAVPKDYLKWLLQNADLQPDLRGDVEEALNNEATPGVGGVKSLQIGDPREPSAPVARFPAQLSKITKTLKVRRHEIIKTTRPPLRAGQETLA
jgi:hypothetical protein